MLTATQTNLQRLAYVRLAILIGLLAIIGYAWSQHSAALPYEWLLSTVALLALVQTFTFWRLRQLWPVGDIEFLSQLLLDVVGLTVLLYWTGGASNPFVSYYLVPLSMAAALLPLSLTALLAVVSLGFYTLLLFFYQPLPLLSALEPTIPGGHDHAFNPHVFGMWFNFAVSATLITYVVARMATTVREQREQLNRQREQALHNEQLLAVASLAAGTAHELGTPLNTMTVLLEELRDAPAADGDIELLQQQVAECRRILRELASTAEAHQLRRYPARPADQFLKAVLNRWQLLRPTASSHLQVVGNGPTPPVQADDALQQAIINLLNNAADTDSGPIELTLSWTDEQIELRVRDHGPGIDLALAERLGTPFVTGKPGRGLGLGLFLSHATVERYGGTIKLLNHAEGGTEAILRLPTVSLARNDNHGVGLSHR